MLKLKNILVMLFVAAIAVGSANAATLPALIEAEDYTLMSGIGTEGCSEGGLNVGWIDAGDWMEYAGWDIPGGTYTVDYRVASSPGGGQLRLELDGGVIQFPTLSVPGTGGWQAWATISQTVTLPSGTHDIMIYAPAGGWNINWFEFTSGDPTTTTTTAATTTTTSATTTTTAAGGNLALNKPATASSDEGAGYVAANAVDGNTGTRWASESSDPQWIYVDLGATYSINQVRLLWEFARGEEYKIQVANSSGGPWTDCIHITDNTTYDTWLTHSFSTQSGRYVRMYGIQRATGYGYSLWEMEVYGGGTTTTTTATTTTTTAATTTTTSATTTTTAAGGNLALNKAAVSSSDEATGMSAEMAVDGDTGTRWSSEFSDPQWIYVDLGGTYSINQVNLLWESACGSEYKIQVADSTGGPWTDCIHITGNTTSGTWLTHSFSTQSGRYVRMYGIQRATGWGYSLWEMEVYGSGGPTTTTTAGTTTTTAAGDFWGDTSSIPPATNVLTFKILNRTNGMYSDDEIYWMNFDGETHTIAEQDTYDMPANSSGRMYFSLGAVAEPANPNAYWDFIEFTIGEDAFHGNTTRVDAFGLKIAMRLHCADGWDMAVGEDEATFAEDRSVTFASFKAAVPAEFDHLADMYAPYRIVNPGGGEFKPGGLYENYFAAYIDEVWNIHPDLGTKPEPGYLEGLGDRPSLSAALHRHTAHLDESQWENESLFYQAAPANFYAEFLHTRSLHGMCYGFPYDDVGGYSSYISHTDPEWLIIAVGW